MDSPVLILSAAHLHMADVARWRASDTYTRAVFEANGNDNVWLTCARMQFTEDRLYVTYELYDPVHRKSCFKFHSMLQRTNCMLSYHPLIVEPVEEAIFLEHRLREAMCECSNHRTVSGRDAQVLLGRFEIFKPGYAMFLFGAKDGLPTIAGLPPGVLSVRMFYEKEHLRTCAMYQAIHGNVLKPCPEAASMRFTLSVASADRDVSMSCRCIPLILDGRLRASVCRCECPIDLECDVDWPILCVLGLLEGESSDTRRRWLANAFEP
eukprot:TRINITY_DN1185_c0_g3_i1.p1 TRINITY_DN1185_c0_g3~~TRINITY_DN1185_c0_g3_i1.p1  ORF type:complete len:266 (-),score=21.54 TRINITY_DN1185_c0_g3_i1:197-994(-)